MGVKGSKFEQSERITKLAERSHKLSRDGLRNIYADNKEFLIYHYSGESPSFAPATGEFAKSDDERIVLGDRNCRVGTGSEFPYLKEMPSKVNGLEYTADNWAEDFSFFLDHSPAEVYENETIVGEYHWELCEVRSYRYTEEIYAMGDALREMGAGGISLAHTCPDLNIGLKLGWSGILEKVNHYQKEWERKGNEYRSEYLKASAKITKAMIRFIRKHSEVALTKAMKETDPEQKMRYQKVAYNCQVLAEGAPQTYEQALQWIHFYKLFDGINGHGNGFGRLDQYLIDFYRKDVDLGILDRDEARNLMAEYYLKDAGYVACAGKDRDGKDATNEVSWIMLEAYDMLGGFNHIGLMWHEDIDPEFWKYGCDVLARHGCGVPTMTNYEVMKQSELLSGYPEEDAWNVAYSGCQWYCAVGNEYSDHDLNCIVLVRNMQRAIDQAIEQNVDNFEDLWKLYTEDLNKVTDQLVAFKNKVYEWQSRLWPEMVTSLVVHGTIEKGLDITDPGSVNNAFTSVNILGVPNVVDSLFAIKKAVFEDKKFTLKEVRDACLNDWEGNEVMRQVMLNQHKFGNDYDDVDEMYLRVSDHIYKLLASKRNIKGFNFRASMFQFMGHTYAGPEMGATPDGRHAEEPLAHGCNPMHGRNTEGITATVSSFLKVDYRRFQGGSLQVDIQPKFFDGKEAAGEYVNKFCTATLRKGCVQINLNVVDLEDLKDAIVHPDKSEYQDIVVKVTGYSAHFVGLDKQLQEEFVERVNYDRI